MSIKKILIIILFLFQNSHTSAQSKEEFLLLQKSVSKIIKENIIEKKIKDSTAIYVFSIKITVKIVKGIQTANIEMSDNDALQFFAGMDSLKYLNYKPFLHKKRISTFLYNNYVLVYGSKGNRNLVTISDIFENLKYLNMTEYKSNYLGNTIIAFDKKIYD